MSEFQTQETETSIAVSQETLREIPNSENFRRTDETVEPGVIRSTFAIRQAEGEPRYEKSVTFDFRDCEADEVCLLCCTNGVVVWAQRVLREMGEGMLNAATLSHVNVKADIIEAPARSFASPEDRARKALARLSPEVRADILASYMPADTE